MTLPRVAIPGDKPTAHPGTMPATKETSDKNGDDGDGGRNFHAESMTTRFNSSNLNLKVKLTSAASASFCKHCNQALGTQNEKSEFCCTGCKVAYEFITSLGLNYFYRLKEKDIESSAHPANEERSLFSHFDDERFASTFIRAESNEQSLISFHIPTIHCAACVWLLEKLPQILPGIIQVRVNLLCVKVVVRFNPSIVRPSVIARTFAVMGYKPHPIANDKTEHLGQKTDRTFLIQLGVAAFAAMNVMLLFFARHEGYLTSIEAPYAQLIAWVSLVLTLPVVTFSALPFYRTSFGSLKNGRLHIDLPISIAIIGGFVASTLNTFLGRSEIYFDTVSALVFLLLLGRWAQRTMMKRIGNATELLHSLAPLSARRIEPSGECSEVYVGALRKGDTIVVSSGEVFPCDGKVLSGQSHIDNSLITGESHPTALVESSQVFSGAKNIGSTLHINVTEIGNSTRLGHLIEQMQSAPVRKSQISRFVDRMSLYFVIGTFSLAALTFFLWIGEGAWTAWDHVISLLIVSCPCALGIATPITLSLAGFRAARRGILIKDGESLERLADIEEIHFDKTGTLTQGELGLVKTSLLSESHSLEWIGKLIYELEEKSEHPIAKAFRREFEKFKSNIQTEPEKEIIEKQLIQGSGVFGVDASRNTYHLGSFRWLEECEVPSCAHLDKDVRFSDTVVGFAFNKKLIALFSFSDRLRPESQSTIQALSKRNIKTHILTGDSSSVARHIGYSLRVAQENIRAELSPEEKSNIIESRGAKAAFVGDGANDGLALSRAGVGIGISGGAEICMSVSDLFLLKPDLNLVVQAIDGAKDTIRQIHRHLSISLLYNVFAVALAITGHIGPLMAALVMPLSSFTVLLSSLWRPPFREKSRI